MDEKKSEEDEKNTSSSIREARFATPEERVITHAAQALIKKETERLTAEKTLETQKNAISRQDEFELIDEAFVQIEAAYNKIVETVSALIVLYNDDADKDESELDNANKSLEKVKERFILAGLTKDKFSLSGKKNNYALSVKYEKKKEKVFSAILNEIKSGKRTGINSKSIESEIGRAIKKQARSKTRLDASDQDALDKLAKKRERAMSQPVIREKRNENMARTAATEEEARQKKYQDDLEMGYVHANVDAPLKMFLLIGLLMILMFGSIVTVLVTEILNWYALFVVILAGAAGFAISQIQLFPSK